MVNFVRLWWIFGQLELMLVYFRSFFVVVHLGVILVNFWSIIRQFISNWTDFSPFFLKIVLSSPLFTQLLLEVNCPGNYFLNYYLRWFGQGRFWVKSRSKGEGRSRVWTQAYNQPIQGSVLDPRTCLHCTVGCSAQNTIHSTIHCTVQSTVHCTVQ